MAGYGTIGAHESEAVLERTLMMKQEVLIYKIPAAQIGDSEKGWMATGWSLDKPDWTGKLRLVAKGTHCVLKLEEKGGNKPFAHVEVDTYPGPAVITVSDSSRYFVIKTNNHDYVGLGFADRADAFDLNVALSGHFKSLRLEDEIEKEGNEPKEKLDLALKEGQMIKVSINLPGKNKRERSRSPAVTGGRPSTAPAIPKPSAAMVAAGIVPPPPKEVEEEPTVIAAPRISAPPVRQANPNWIQF